MNENESREWLAKRYTTTCPHCDKTIHPTRSLGMMVFGLREGYGDCPYCKNNVMIKWDPEADTLTAGRDALSDKLNAKRAEKLS